MLRGRSLGQAIGVVALVCATFGVSTASAQVDYEIMASLQFNFSNPGARSLAMAGALTGAGDDATGAWTNPGGLTNITRPEVGVEFRGFGFETPFVSCRPLQRQPTNSRHRHGQRAAPTATRTTRRTACRSSRRSCPSRASPSRSTAPKSPTTRPTSRPWLVLRRPGPSAPCRAPFFPVDGNLDLQISNFGGSAAVRLTDQVSVGVGVSFYDFEHQLGEPPLRPWRPPDRRGRLLRPAASYASDNVVPPSSSSGEDSALRHQHRRVDQPERQVPHRRQLPPGPEVRHRLPARRLHRHL